MPVLTNSPTLGDLLKYELDRNYTREVVTLAAGTDYALGAVLGRITATGADATGVIVARGPAIVSKAALVFDDSIDGAAEIAAKHNQLVAAGIVPRDTA